MKTLFLVLMIALGVAGVLYCRVNLGMSWSDMSGAIESLIPRGAALVVVLLGAVVTLGYISRLGNAE